MDKPGFVVAIFDDFLAHAFPDGGDANSVFS